jgi:hypothetical protein
VRYRKTFALLGAAAVLAASSSLLPADADPVPPGTSLHAAVPRPAGWDSSYLGHTGFRNEPITIGLDDTPILDAEAAMGLKWSFVSTIWALFEPEGPTDARHDTAGSWKKLDDWVSAARDRGLNLYVQPTMGGNGVQPPAWAGRRIPAGYNETQTWTNPDGSPGSADQFVFPFVPSAPSNLQAAVDFYVKLVRRYKQGGELAQEKGWTDNYGVEVWEIDNEPDSYGLWYAEWDDYAELVSKAYPAIKAEDPNAVVVAPAAAHSGSESFLRAFLDKRMQRASVDYLLNGVQYAGGPFLDVISLHHYGTLTGTDDGGDIETTVHNHRAVWDQYATQPGFEYPTNREYWHTEGNLNFSGTSDDSDPDLEARAFMQYLTKGFAGGLSRMTVMDLHEDNAQDANARRALAVYMGLFPQAGGMQRLAGPSGPYELFRRGDAAWTYVAWTTGATTTVSVPVRTAHARVMDKYGATSLVAASGGSVTATLAAGVGASEPVYIVEAP